MRTSDLISIAVALAVTGTALAQGKDNFKGGAKGQSSGPRVEKGGKAIPASSPAAKPPAQTSGKADPGKPATDQRPAPKQNPNKK